MKKFREYLAECESPTEKALMLIIGLRPPLSFVVVLAYTLLVFVAGALIF